MSEENSQKVSSPPTATEINAFFGLPENAPTGFRGTVEAEDGRSYLILSNGKSWYYLEGKKAK